MMCTYCIKKFHSTIKAGNVIDENSYNCIWCRNTKISHENLTKWNNILSVLPYDDIKFGNDYYGICSECTNIEFYCKKVCSSSAPKTDKFICSSCRPDAHIVKCPKCEAPTIKDGGCNHITCHCGAEYCYICCDEIFKTEDEVNKHFNTIHTSRFEDAIVTTQTNISSSNMSTINQSRLRLGDMEYKQTFRPLFLSGRRISGKTAQIVEMLNLDNEYFQRGREVFNNNIIRPTRLVYQYANSRVNLREYTSSNDIPRQTDTQHNSTNELEEFD